MNRTVSSLVALACMSLAAASSYAQQESAFVSDVGDDANSCFSTDEACRSIDAAGGALSQTFERGVINVLPGNYGGFVIDKGIDILADNGQAVMAGPLAETVPVIGGSAKIVVNAGAGDAVRIRGFITDSAFVNNGSSYGIAFVTGGALHLEDCTLLNASGSYGLLFAPSSASELYISNCTISGNSRGILVAPRGSGGARVVLENVRIENNVNGIMVDGRGTTGTNTVTIRNSTIGGSDNVGLFAIDNGGGATNVVVEGSTVAGNGTNGVSVNGTNATVRLRNSTVSGNNQGLAKGAGGQVISHGGNVVIGNSVNGTFNSTVAQQ